MSSQFLIQTLLIIAVAALAGRRCARPEARATKPLDV